MRTNSTTIDWTRTSIKADVPLKPDTSMSLDLWRNHSMNMALFQLVKNYQRESCKNYQRHQSRTTKETPIKNYQRDSNKANPGLTERSWTHVDYVQTLQ